MGEKNSGETGQHSTTNDAVYGIPRVLFSKQKRPPLSALNSQDGYKMSYVKWHRMYAISVSSQTMKTINHTETASLNGKF